MGFFGGKFLVQGFFGGGLTFAHIRSSSSLEIRTPTPLLLGWDCYCFLCLGLVIYLFIFCLFVCLFVCLTVSPGSGQSSSLQIPIMAK